MKLQVLTALVLVLAVGAGVNSAQSKAKPKQAGFPAYVAKLEGRYPDKPLGDPVIKARLKKLLGRTAYASFMESYETQTPFVKSGSILFSSGCLIHACTKVESAFAIDLTNKTVHAAFFRAYEPIRYFNEKGLRTPAVVKEWADGLTVINTKEQ